MYEGQRLTMDVFLNCLSNWFFEAGSPSEPGAQFRIGSLNKDLQGTTNCLPSTEITDMLGCTLLFI